jgi:hypothetical protein
VTFPGFSVAHNQAVTTKRLHKKNFNFPGTSSPQKFCGLLQPFVAFCGLLWPFVAFCGFLWLLVAFCGRLWPFVAFCGFLWCFT